MSESKDEMVWMTNLLNIAIKKKKKKKNLYFGNAIKARENGQLPQ